MRTFMRDLPRAMAVHITPETLTVDLEDGRTIGVPLVWFPRLLAATPEQRSRFELIGRGIGIHWPDIDEDLSVQGLLNPPVREPVRTETAGADSADVGLADSDHPTYGSGKPVRGQLVRA